MHGPAPHFSDLGTSVQHFTAIAALSGATELSPVLGHVTKHPENPLFRTSNAANGNAWEHDVNNGYSSVLYDANNSLGHGTYRAFYSAADSNFTESPGCHGECDGGSAMLYATSDDGITWVKPALHKYAWNGTTANNILFTGVSTSAVYDDGWHETDPSRRFKAWGNLAGVGPLPPLSSPSPNPIPPGWQWKTPQIAGTAVSADGLTWTSYRRLQNATDKAPNVWRFDALASLFFDGLREEYVGTMRAFRPCATCGLCPIWWQPSDGCQDKLSADCTAEQCNRTVRAIGAAWSDGGDFDTTGWSSGLEVTADHDDPRVQIYSQVSFPFYDVYLAIVMAFDAADPKVDKHAQAMGTGKVRCELAWSKTGREYTRLSPGTPFIPQGVYVPNSTKNEFDSHVCFAAAHPIKLADHARIYYMGGDGPHYSEKWGSPGHRNSSWGLATMRPDRFVGMGAANGSAGTGRTSPLLFSAPQLLITADAAPAGHVSVRVISAQLPGGYAACAPIERANVTDAPLSGCNLSAIVGQGASLELTLKGGAVVYVLGFA
jgi:hypothetical protein